MRRFVRTFLVRRRGQFTVIQDGEKRVFEVWKFSAAHGLEVIARYPYAPDRGAADFVRGVAIGEAKRRVEAELKAGDRGETAMLAPDRALAEDEVTPVDETAARLGIAPPPIAKTRTICAWCEGWDKDDPANSGASHGMCPACQAREHAKLDAEGFPR